LHIRTITTSHIDITIFKERRGVYVPLLLHFKYKPSVGAAPIREIADSRNEHIKQFHWKLWYGDNVLPRIDIRDKFTGLKVIFKAEAVEMFCAVVGNQNESFKTARNLDVTAPVDFVIDTGWQVSLWSACRSLKYANPVFYTMLGDGSTVFNSPLTNEQYSEVRQECRCEMSPRSSSCVGSFDRFGGHFLIVSCRYDVISIGMVFPGDELKVNTHHVGMRNGNIVVKIETINDRGEKVLEGSAEVA
jgi:hypothetical protein